ncbi:hypothetical protein TNCV_2333141 [Trichonephila clavipes]|nr:hypothetical protein TNCV_2333141 [Trichonephila clavipes]
MCFYLLSECTVCFLSEPRVRLSSPPGGTRATDFVKRWTSRDRGSLLFKVTDALSTCHEFEPSTTEDLLCRGSTFNISRLTPPVGVEVNNGVASSARTKSQRITQSENTDESSTSQEKAIPPKAPSAKTIEKTAPMNQVPPIGEKDKSSKERASRTRIQDEETEYSDISDVDEIPPPQRPEVTIDEHAVAKLCEMIYNDYRKLCTKTRRFYMSAIYKNWYSNRIETDSS